MQRVKIVNHDGFTTQWAQNQVALLAHSNAHFYDPFYPLVCTISSVAVDGGALPQEHLYQRLQLQRPEAAYRVKGKGARPQEPHKSDTFPALAPQWMHSIALLALSPCKVTHLAK